MSRICQQRAPSTATRGRVAWPDVRVALHTRTADPELCSQPTAANDPLTSKENFNHLLEGSQYYKKKIYFINANARIIYRIYATQIKTPGVLAMDLTAFSLVTHSLVNE